MDKRIVFVHGLGGNKDTWGNFENFLQADPDIHVKTAFWDYRTCGMGIKLSHLFKSEYQGVRDLAESFKAYIDEVHFDADEIILVGHSLGGLIIRQYLLNEALNNSNKKIRQVVLYAVPNYGSQLASVSKVISLWSWKSHHLWDLGLRSSFLENLNRAWKIANLEDIIEFTVVVAGDDKIVTIESAEGTFKHLNIIKISGVGHLDICKPSSSLSQSYTILKNVISKNDPC